MRRFLALIAVVVVVSWMAATVAAFFMPIGVFGVSAIATFSMLAIAATRILGPSDRVEQIDPDALKMLLDPEERQIRFLTEAFAHDEISLEDFERRVGAALERQRDADPYQDDPYFSDLAAAMLRPIGSSAVVPMVVRPTNDFQTFETHDSRVRELESVHGIDPAGGTFGGCGMLYAPPREGAT